MLIWLIQLLPYFVFAVYQFSLRSHGLPASPPAVFCPPGVLFGPVHFNGYPLKSEYKEYTLEKILEFNPLACIQSTIRYNQQDSWIFSTPKLFRGKFNYLPAYNLTMEPPVTPKPMPASAPNLPTNHTGKLFGIVYFTLTGVIDTIIPAASPWSWVGKSASYLLKLIPLLWGILYKLPQELCVYPVDHPSVLNLFISIGVCGRPEDDIKWANPKGDQFVRSAKSMCVMEEHPVAYLELLERGLLDVIFFLTSYLLGQCIGIGF
ncbi:hypothetical protein DSO57_1012618 [Entomophthora muscae]|uniref:Uncharacterized protein n=1 Tax=Entomophthora muscae TaxID=34485 RepID=A0ACC2RKY1_9FUNG|nr:hypothetical protein DSO57_1012618 [Entomophthora muscae]